MHKLMHRISALKWQRIKELISYASINVRWWVEVHIGLTYPASIDSIRTSMTKVEKHTLYSLAKRLPVGSIMAEVGSYYGASSCCLASAAKKRAKVYCIDTWRNDAVSDEREDIFATYSENIAPYTNIVIPVRGYSYEVKDAIPDDLSLLFIDGDHSYDGVKRDLINYLPKLRPHGILVMHDWNHNGVRRAIEELVLPMKVKLLIMLPNMFSCRLTNGDR